MRIDVKKTFIGLVLAGAAGGLLLMPAVVFIGTLLAPTEPALPTSHVPPVIGDALWAMANGGKILTEGDPEVSEAVDFVEFYRATARRFYEMSSVQTAPCGVVVVVPPWNFPIAIPCGGIAAALAAGDTVILKPASDTVLVAWELCQCFWRAGVPKTALQFAPGPGATAGQRLVSHPDVHAIILTGGTTTAVRMLKARPDVRLFAYAYSVVDTQLQHSTRVAIPGLAFQHEAGWYLDLGPDAPSTVGEEWFSVQGLISAGR